MDHASVDQRPNSGSPVTTTPSWSCAATTALNLGEVLVEGDQIFGDGVNIAARIQALAEAGGIRVSSLVYEQIDSKAPSSSRAWVGRR